MRIPLNDLLFALSKALDFVERELLSVTTNHGKRVAYVSARVCRAMGLEERDIFDMACCAVLHDNALTQYMHGAGPDGLSRLENFKSHCERGEENALSFPFAGDPSGIILYHHENWDGSGFFHLAGEAIPLRAGVLRLADNMDLALRMGDGRGGLIDAIRQHALRFKGVLYPPAAVEALLEVLDADFIRAMTDENISAALKGLLPSIRVDLSTEQVLRLCSVFAFIIDAKSPFTMNHSTGVAERVAQLARSYGLDPEHRDKLVVAAYLHDVGKLAIPPGILEKNGPLDAQEWNVMRNHAAVTAEILGEVPGLEDLAAWAAEHHEKLNGQGYPFGLGREELSFESRLLACCDIYQALTENRPYRRGMDHGKAMVILNDMVARGELDEAIAAHVGEVFAAEVQEEGRCCV